MNHTFLNTLWLVCLTSMIVPVFAATTSERAANTVVLDKVSVQNLSIETVEATPTTFEERLFAVGRIEAIPSRRGVVSSRIPGRILSLEAFEADHVTQGQRVARIESRRSGDPPPSIDLLSPVEGMVMPSHVSVGEPIEPDTEIMEIIDLRAVHAVARVPEDQAGGLKIGTKARIKIAALPERVFEGEMLRFGTQADPVGGTVDAVFLLQGLDGSLRPNMRAEFSMLLDKRENVLSIPKEALQGDEVQSFVFVKDFDLKNAFVKAPVKLGARNDQYIEVIGGLFPGDEVVTTGSYSLAFAGAGSISLKEALDEAHGHEHNEDGSELTAGQKAGKDSENAGGAGGGGSGFTGLTLFLAILSGLLGLLLVLSLFFFRRGAVSNDA